MNKIKKLLLPFTFLIYIAILLRLTIFRPNILAQRSMNLVPFADLVQVWRNYSLGTFIWLFGGNIGWFVPFGFMLPLMWRRFKGWHVIGMGSAFSLTIEVTQYFTRRGVAELDDLILNTLGVAIGYLLYWLIFVRCRHIKGQDYGSSPQ